MDASVQLIIRIKAQSEHKCLTSVGTDWPDPAPSAGIINQIVRAVKISAPYNLVNSPSGHFSMRACTACGEHEATCPVSGRESGCVKGDQSQDRCENAESFFFGEVKGAGRTTLHMSKKTIQVFGHVTCFNRSFYLVTTKTRDPVLIFSY